MQKKLPKELEIIMKKAFDKYDSDKSGELDPEELRKLQDDISLILGFPPLTQKQAERAIKLIDVDNDGDVQFKELLAGIGQVIDKIFYGPRIEKKSSNEQNEDFSDLENIIDSQFSSNKVTINPNFIRGLGRQIKIFDKLAKKSKSALDMGYNSPDIEISSVNIGLGELDHCKFHETGETIPIDSQLNNQTTDNDTSKPDMKRMTKLKSDLNNNIFENEDNDEIPFSVEPNNQTGVFPMYDSPPVVKVFSPSPYEENSDCIKEDKVRRGLLKTEGNLGIGDMLPRDLKIDDIGCFQLDSNEVRQKTVSPEKSSKFHFENAKLMTSCDASFSLKNKSNENLVNKPSIGEIEDKYCAYLSEQNKNNSHNEFFNGILKKYIFYPKNIRSQFFKEQTHKDFTALLKFIKDEKEKFSNFAVLLEDFNKIFNKFWKITRDTNITHTPNNYTKKTDPPKQPHSRNKFKLLNNKFDSLILSQRNHLKTSNDRVKRGRSFENHHVKPIKNPYSKSINVVDVSLEETGPKGERSYYITSTKDMNNKTQNNLDLTNKGGVHNCYWSKLKESLINNKLRNTIVNNNESKNTKSYLYSIKDTTKLLSGIRLSTKNDRIRNNSIRKNGSAIFGKNINEALLATDKLGDPKLTQFVCDDYTNKDGIVQDNHQVINIQILDKRNMSLLSPQKQKVREKVNDPSLENYVEKLKPGICVGRVGTQYVSTSLEGKKGLYSEHKKVWKNIDQNNTEV